MERVEKRPGILIIGSANVGKRTLISRFLSANFEDAFDSSSELLVHGWTIDTKYYSADVAVWMAHLHNGFSIASLPCLTQLAALVMVFDMSELSSLAALKKWVAHTDIQRFDILLCVGNKVDLVPGHPVHNEYKRHLQKHGNTFVRSDADFSDYGISETEGSSLLGNDEPTCDISRSCLEWCMERNIEYVEACASNVNFDKCIELWIPNSLNPADCGRFHVYHESNAPVIASGLSVDGDSQGVERLIGALSAHMWPGMVLKSGNRIPTPILPERQESSEEDTDYEADYEILSKGSVDELWDETEEGWVSAHGPGSSSTEATVLDKSSSVETAEPSSSVSSVRPTELNTAERAETSGPEASVGKEHAGLGVCEEDDIAFPDDDLDKGAHLELEDLDHIMSEIANMRSSSRLMPDFQRREMAAKLAMKMAAMFGDSSGDEAFE